MVKQRDCITEQKREMTDSIHYAKRIQTALLLPENVLKQHFHTHFVIFKPRDIVSGDFYWFKKIGDILVFAAVDCTGHGVPGALMSMLGIAFLNEIVRRKEVTQTNQILNILRDYVKEALNQTGKEFETKDGMDMAICAIDTKTGVLQYSGAYNSLILIQNNQLSEYKADRMPIGIYPNEYQSFTNHKIQLIHGDLLYVFSDGFIDQFGGEQGKKFKLNGLKKQLLQIANRNMEEQKQLLEQTFDEWKGTEHEQIDDVVMLGIKYSQP